MGVEGEVSPLWCPCSHVHGMGPFPCLRSQGWRPMFVVLAGWASSGVSCVAWPSANDVARALVCCCHMRCALSRAL